MVKNNRGAVPLLEASLLALVLILGAVIGVRAYHHAHTDTSGATPTQANGSVDNAVNATVDGAAADQANVNSDDESASLTEDASAARDVSGSYDENSF